MRLGPGKLTDRTAPLPAGSPCQIRRPDPAKRPRSRHPVHQRIHAHRAQRHHIGALCLFDLGAGEFRHIALIGQRRSCSARPGHLCHGLSNLGRPRAGGAAARLRCRSRSGGCSSLAMRRQICGRQDRPDSGNESHIRYPTF